MRRASSVAGLLPGALPEGRLAEPERRHRPAAARLWTRLDRELTDRAILLPTVTLNTTDLVSARVRNYHYNPVWGALVDQFWVR